MQRVIILLLIVAVVLSLVRLIRSRDSKDGYTNSLPNKVFTFRTTSSLGNSYGLWTLDQDKARSPGNWKYRFLIYNEYDADNKQAFSRSASAEVKVEKGDMVFQKSGMLGTDYIPIKFVYDSTKNTVTLNFADNEELFGDRVILAPASLTLTQSN